MCCHQQADYYVEHMRYEHAHSLHTTFYCSQMDNFFTYDGSSEIEYGDRCLRSVEKYFFVVVFQCFIGYY